MRWWEGIESLINRSGVTFHSFGLHSTPFNEGSPARPPCFPMRQSRLFLLVQCTPTNNNLTFADDRIVIRKPRKTEKQFHLLNIQPPGQLYWRREHTKTEMTVELGSTGSILPESLQINLARKVTNFRWKETDVPSSDGRNDQTDFDSDSFPLSIQLHSHVLSYIHGYSMWKEWHFRKNSKKTKGSENNKAPMLCCELLAFWSPTCSVLLVRSWSP